MASPPSRFVIVPQQSRSPLRSLLWLLAWLLSVVAAAWLTYRYSVPLLAKTSDALEQSRGELQQTRAELEEALQKNAVLARSDQVSRDAMNQLQGMLAEREEEIAGLRADVVFYERLVGGSAQRKGLTIHSVEFAPRADGDLDFHITLTQNLKKSGLTRGSLSFAIEGSQQGRLQTLSWAELRQQPEDEAAAIEFEFRYFQRVDGSVILPAGFTPHRVRVKVERDGSAVERTVPWEDTQGSEGEKA